MKVISRSSKRRNINTQNGDRKIKDPNQTQKLNLDVDRIDVERFLFLVTDPMSDLKTPSNVSKARVDYTGSQTSRARPTTSSINADLNDVSIYFHLTTLAF